jgi:hypothetical protein
MSIEGSLEVRGIALLEKLGTFPAAKLVKVDTRHNLRKKIEPTSLLEARRRLVTYEPPPQTAETWETDIPTQMPGYREALQYQNRAMAALIRFQSNACSVTLRGGGGGGGGMVPSEDRGVRPQTNVRALSDFLPLPILSVILGHLETTSTHPNLARILNSFCNQCRGSLQNIVGEG